jgi:predicted TIM-barrel fold metal-dependent hydrolase
MMKFFDANCCLGKLSVPLPKCLESTADLVLAMKKAGVEEALVYHSYSKEYHPAVGNQKLLEEITGLDSLYACWTLLPDQTAEMPKPEKILNDIAEKSIAAVRVFPKTQNWSISEWSAGHLLQELEEMAVPLLIDLEETGWDQLFSLCAKHPDLPVVLTRVPFRFSRHVYALLAETSNLYIETSFFQLHGGIEDICAKFGAGRLLFGTASPFFDPGPSVMAIKYAEISEEDRARIAGGNLHELIKTSIEKRSLQRRKGKDIL